MPSFNVAEAKRTPQIVIRDGKGDVVTVVTPRDLQVGFEGSPGALILKGALDINAFVLQISSPADAANVRVSNDKIAYFILNDSGVGVTVKLPTPPANPGQTHIIKDYRGTASNATPITITTDDGSTIDGQTAQNIVIAYGAIMFVWTGQGWVSLALGASGAGGGAPNNARYVVWGTEIGLSNSRVLSVTSGHLTLDTTAPNANLGLANTGTPGTYTFPSEITVDSQGRVTSITSTTGSGGNADPGAQYIVMALTASLTNERVATQGLGIRITDGGANGPATWAINNSVVATISGSTFTGATLHTAGLSGSLTRLTDGRSYIVGGTGITVTSASNGQITIVGAAASSSVDAPINATYLVLTADGTLTAERVFAPINGIKFTDGGAGGTYNIFIDDRIVATISGSTFSGVTNHTAGLSGSLTRLTNGQSYLVAGANIIITSASNGQVTITSTASGSGGGGAGTGDNGAAYVVMALTASLPNERVLAAGTGIAITDNGPNSSVVISTNGSSNRIMRYGITHETATTTQPSSSVESIGMTYFDQSTLPIGTKSYYFKSILAPSTGSTVAYLELYDYNGIISGVPQIIQGSIVTGSSTTFTYFSKDLTSVLTSVTGSGIFEARLWCTPTGSNLAAICKSAWLEVQFSGTPVTQSNKFNLMNGIATTDQGSGSNESLGMAYLDQTQLPSGTKKFYFRTILAPVSGTTVAYADLYDYNGIINGIPQPISGSVVTGSSTTFTYFSREITAALSSVTGSGIIEARFWCTPTGSNRAAIVKSAMLEVETT